MNTGSTTTALLLFARSSAGENREKWLPEGERIYSRLNSRAYSLAKESGLDFFHSTEADQIGLDFGSRFAHAIKRIFDQGYTSVISIGNDTPQLTQNDIRQAIRQIKNKKSVIGPSQDGGIYLLGIHASDYDCEDFSRLKWCTRHVQECLTDYFESRGQKPFVLRPYRDIDTVRDLVVLSNLQSFIPFGILYLLRRAIRRFITWFNLTEIFSLQPLWQAHLTRGSPR